VAEALVSQYTRDDGTVVVELRGEIDLQVDEALRTLLVELATKRRPPQVVVDMKYVTFVDSTGVGALAAGYNAARTYGSSLVVRDPAPFVEKQLRVSGLYDRLVEGA
jgi:anti-sigma B factor antagonist